MSACAGIRNIIDLPVDQHGRLKVSANGRYIVHEDETPFFWLADTAWELFHRLTREDTMLYLDDRLSKGFTVIQAVVLAELDGLKVPNAYGEIPLNDMDPENPNEAYFEHVDWVINTAQQKGLYIALLPTWGDKIDKRYDWAKGPEIFTVSNAYTYGKWLAERYSDKKNIAWILGGDRDPDQQAIEIWRSMASGIVKGAGGKEKTLMSFHPQPFDSGSSSRWFHHDTWLDFNMLQTGHDKQKNTFKQIATEYALIPTKPVIDAESTYEAHGLNFDHVSNGYASDTEVRKYAYWNLFSGAFGYTYGCHCVWQFYTPEREGINNPKYHWKDALHLAGATQMKYLKKIMTERTHLNRIPDQTIILDNFQEGEDFIVATRADDGSYALIYSPTGKEVTLNMEVFGGRAMQYYWFNPRDGMPTIARPVSDNSIASYVAPNGGYGHDWVLVVETRP